MSDSASRTLVTVTTDFDVIEDMLVKDWNVAYAFQIRYKHLMTHGKQQQGTDEDVERIQRASPESEDVDDMDQTNDNYDMDDLPEDAEDVDVVDVDEAYEDQAQLLQQRRSKFSGDFLPSRRPIQKPHRQYQIKQEGDFSRYSSVRRRDTFLDQGRGGQRAQYSSYRDDDPKQRRFGETVGSRKYLNPAARRY